MMDKIIDLKECYEKRKRESDMSVIKYKKSIYQKNKKNHICVVCRKNKSIENRTMCGVCKNKRNSYRRRIRRERRVKKNA